MSLLALPPELIHDIFRQVLTDPPFRFDDDHLINFEHDDDDDDLDLDPRLVVPLTLIHPSLVSIALEFMFVDLSFDSDRRCRQLVVDSSNAFSHKAHTTRRIEFNVDGRTSRRRRRSRGRDKPRERMFATGFGIAANDDTIDGKLAQQVLDTIERTTMMGAQSLTELDLRDCRGVPIDVLTLTCLANLKTLSIGTGFTFTRSDAEYATTTTTFPFELRSLRVANNHWESVPVWVLERLVAPNSLETLDLSDCYSVDSILRLLDDDGESPGRASMFKSVRELYLPRFESFRQVLFSTRLLDRISTTSSHGSDSSESEDEDEDGGRLEYVELPTLGFDPASQSHLAPLLASIRRSRRDLVEIGFQNEPGPSLLDSILIVLQAIYGGAPETVEARSSGARLRRVRMVKIVPRGRAGGTAEVSRLIERDGELVVDLIGQFGCEVEYGPYRRPRRRRE